MRKDDVVKKDVYKTQIKNIEDKIPDITNVATNTTLNDKINEVKNENTTLNAKINEVKTEMPSITNFTATIAVNAKIYEVKNKIPNITDLATTENYYWSYCCSK